MESLSIIKSILNKFSNSNSYILTDEHKQCFEILENTGQNLFITGKAGTGKSALIQHFRQSTKKKVVVLAPTGIAALNIRGQTIHSFFGFPPLIIDPKSIRKNRFERIFSDIDCIIIDEISMVRADLLDGVDRFLRLNGRSENLPFGGIQMIFAGDLYQLPPVVTQDEAGIFSQLYDSPYFFSANSFRLEDFQTIELKTIFRQKEIEFVDFLNSIRVGETPFEKFNLVNNKTTNKYLGDNHVILCTVNKTAMAINEKKLNTINGPLFTYQATVEDDFPTEDRNLPVDLKLKLKKGAKVLFVKNDPNGRWVNGTLGTVEYLEKNLIGVKIEDTKQVVEVNIEEWNNVKYEIDEQGMLNEKILGKLKQYPLRLAWAITIHKSQGMSLSKVCIDFSHSPFAHGQTYVALSRCRSLDGLILSRRIWPNDVIIDDRIIEFHKKLSSSMIK